jgi:hypothetical protein
MHWADGYTPGESLSHEPELVPRKGACGLNTPDENPDFSIMLLFTPQESSGPYQITNGAARTLHHRFNGLTDPGPVLRYTSYSRSLPVQVVVQPPKLASRNTSVAEQESVR